MSEEREEYAAGAGWASEKAGASATPSRLSGRADLDISIKRWGGQGPVAAISHHRSSWDMLYMTDQGIFVGAIYLSWEEVDEVRKLVQ